MIDVPSSRRPVNCQTSASQRVNLAGDGADFERHVERLPEGDGDHEQRDGERPQLRRRRQSLGLKPAQAGREGAAECQASTAPANAPAVLKTTSLTEATRSAGQELQRLDDKRQPESQRGDPEDPCDRAAPAARP